MFWVIFLFVVTNERTLLKKTGYWGRGAMDPEPGRCKRTDGKKWRCSRDVVAGHKYCDRHIHRGRNRSRKPVETTTTTTTTATTAASSFVLGEELGHRPNNNHFFSNGSSQHLHLNHHHQRYIKKYNTLFNWSHH